MKLFDKAKIIRSKNAGPLTITFDLMFDDPADLKEVLAGLTAEKIAAAYGIDPKSIAIIPYEVVNAVKITFPRRVASGSIADDDVYGCQQHMPLANIEL